MTAKEKLAEQIEQFTEEEAEEALALLGLDERNDWPDFPPAPPHIMEMARRSLDDYAEGRFRTDEELDREFGPT